MDIDASTTSTPISEPMIPVSDAPVNALFVPPAPTSNGEGSSSKPAQAQKQGKKKNRKMKRYLPEPYSSADVTYRDVRDFLGAEYVDDILTRRDESEWAAPVGLELWSVVELTAGAFTVSGKLTLFLHCSMLIVKGSLYRYISQKGRLRNGQSWRLLRTLETGSG